jgi:2,3,4,5-tetrahydropyridine-2,6-dicarboxylate N-succinyltransferase
VKHKKKLVVKKCGDYKIVKELEEIVESAFENRAQITADNVDKKLKDAIHTIIDLLDEGKLRIAEKVGREWYVHQWLKKAVLLFFRIENNQPIAGTFTQFYDKVPLKFSDSSKDQFSLNNVRIVPPACARKGAYIAPNTVLMPSYINIGAYVDTGVMVDTWATVGSCAQIGKNVHLSGGVGIGGVLEPIQANPTIIEDNCFIGARSEIVEGVIIEENAVISMGVYIGQSTKIYHREKDEITYGKIPAGSVVVPGNLPSKDGKYSLYCAIIVKQVDQKTREKIGINELLRGCMDAKS